MDIPRTNRRDSHSRLYLNSASQGSRSEDARLPTRFRPRFQPGRLPGLNLRDYAPASGSETLQLGKKEGHSCGRSNQLVNCPGQRLQILYQNGLMGNSSISALTLTGVSGKVARNLDSGPKIKQRSYHEKLSQGTLV